MTGTSRDRQPELLDAFWAALQADTMFQPAVALDEDTAELVRDLEHALHPPEPNARFVATLRNRLRAASASAPTNGVVQTLPSALTETPRTLPDSGSEPSTVQRRSGVVREMLKLAAGIVVVVVFAQLLSLLFRDNSDDGQSVERINDFGAPFPEAATSKHQIILSTIGDEGEQRLIIVSTDGSQEQLLIPEGTLDGDQAEGVWSPDGSRIAFSVSDGISSDIYVTNADGSDLRRLTPPPTWTPDESQHLNQSGPAWSPDGTRIAFSSNLNDGYANFDIYLVDPDGSNLQRLQHDASLDFTPRWSPDGSKIAYEAVGSSEAPDGMADRYGNVYVMNADGSDRRRLVETIGGSAPNWSPDGEWIAYSDGRFGSAVHIVRADGTETRDLTGVGMVAESPRWSPDGALLAWRAHADGGSMDGILVFDLSNGETRLISSLTGTFTWSPTGDWLVVAMPEIDRAGSATGAGGLYLVKPDGSHEELLQHIRINEHGTTLDWRPSDDTRSATDSPVAPTPAGSVAEAPVRLIAWANDIYGDSAFKVVVGDSAGATPAKLMGGPFREDMSHERSPVWSPDGLMIVIVTDRDGNDELYVVSGRRPGSSSMPDDDETVLDTSGPRNITNNPGSDSDPAWSSDSRWIAFSSLRNDNQDIYLTQVGSAEPIRLTTDPGSDMQPVWSPDGSRIAFVSDRDGWQANIYVMNADGSEQRRVSLDDGVSGSPAWSPDGQYLAYTTILGGAKQMSDDLRLRTSVVNVATNASRTIADDPAPGVASKEPAALGAAGVAWSPDGALLAFTRPIGEQFDLGIANADGNGLTMLTNTPERDELAPAWSPEGQHVLYTTIPRGARRGAEGTAELRIIDRTGSIDRQIAPLSILAALYSRPAWGPLASEAREPIPDATTPDTTAVPTTTTVVISPTATTTLIQPTPDTNICVHSSPSFSPGVFIMNADGSQQQLLIQPELPVSSLSWSPDGQRLLGRYGGIIVMNADGSLLHSFSRGLNETFDDAIWSPDGTRIAYVQSGPSIGGSALFTANPDGSNPLQLTTTIKQAGTIAWSPDGSRIAFAANHDETWHIFTIASDGSDQRHISSIPPGAINPSWSANGSSLRYLIVTNVAPGVQDLDYFEVDLASGESSQLDIFKDGDHSPVWSTDDSRIAFQRDGDIWSMAADGSDRRNLTQHPIYSVSPVWSPDGTQILFLSHRVYWQPASEINGQPEPIVVRSGEFAQEGGGGRWCQRKDSGMTAHDVVGVVVPTEPLVSATGATVEIDSSALGGTTAVAVDIYDLTVAAQLGQFQNGVLVPPCRTDEGCHVETVVLTPAAITALTLDLPPGNYALAVRANFDGANGRGFTEQGFRVVVAGE